MTSSLAAEEQRAAAASTAATSEPSRSSNDGGNVHILLGVTGSVATVKLREMIALLQRIGCVKVVATRHGLHFVDTAVLPADVPLHTDEEDWYSWKRVGDEVLHIELRRWAHALVIAPLSANTLAKIAAGMCDNLLTCVVRAWDFTHKPLLVAPAMNTMMWDNPFTAQHIAVLTKLGVHVVAPVSKKLACGDVGVGAMASPQTIADAVQQLLLQ